MNEYIERAAAMESILGLAIVDPAVAQYANAVCYHRRCGGEAWAVGKVFNIEWYYFKG